jgi:hypothetical protein
MGKHGGGVGLDLPHMGTLSSLDAGIGVSSAAVPNAEQQAFDFTWDRGYPSARYHQHAITDAPYEACPGIRVLEHRCRTNLDLGTDDTSDRIGDREAIPRADLD